MTVKSSIGAPAGLGDSSALPSLSPRMRAAIARGRSPDLTAEQIAEACAPMPRAICKACDRAVDDHSIDEARACAPVPSWLGFCPFASTSRSYAGSVPSPRTSLTPNREAPE
jgi:hypothetical protein